MAVQTKIKIHSSVLIVFATGAMALALPARAGNESQHVDLGIASTPNEFRCEALDSSTFDSVNASMDSLRKALNDSFGIDDSCVSTALNKPENQKHLSTLLDQIRGGVNVLRGQIKSSALENISDLKSGKVSTEKSYEISEQGQKLAKDAVVTLVGAFKELNSILAKNPLNISSGKNCKTHYSSSERFVFGVAELIEDVSPLLIQAVSKVPGLQEFAPAVIATTMVSSAVNHYADIAQKRVDINKPENRRAILVNTCQITKTYNRMKMLRGLKDNSMEERQKLQRMITEQSDIINQAVELQKSIEPGSPQERQWLQGLEIQSQNTQLIGKLRSSLSSQDWSGYCDSAAAVNDVASSVKNNHAQISAMTGQKPSFNEFILAAKFETYSNALKETDLSTADCSQRALTLLELAASLNQRTSQILLDFKVTRLAKNPQLLKATAHLDFLQSFQSVLESMNTDDLFSKLQFNIEKTESQQNQSRVLKSWFGNAKTFYWPFDDYRNPVMDLMNYFETLFSSRLKVYLQESNKFELSLYQLYAYWHPKKQDQTPQDHYEEFRKQVRQDLSVLNPTYLDMSNRASPNGRSVPHQRACMGLLTLRNNYRTMMDSWNNLKYFCAMMSPLMLEPEVSKALKERCLGSGDLIPNSSRNKWAGVDRLLEPVSRDIQRMPQIVDKIRSLDCER